MTSTLKRIISTAFWTIWILIGILIIFWDLLWLIKILTYKPEVVPSLVGLVTTTTASIAAMSALLIYGIAFLVAYIVLTVIFLLIKRHKRKNDRISKSTK
ncbi:Uncharacterised protein [uncultured archaeon]|nr:Uncharacterised protein [uncultured archaeon]